MKTGGAPWLWGPTLSSVVPLKGEQNTTSWGNGGFFLQLLWNILKEIVPPPGQEHDEQPPGSCFPSLFVTSSTWAIKRALLSPLLFLVTISLMTLIRFLKTMNRATIKKSQCLCKIDPKAHFNNKHISMGRISCCERPFKNLTYSGILTGPDLKNKKQKQKTAEARLVSSPL